MPGTGSFLGDTFLTLSTQVQIPAFCRKSICWPKLRPLTYSGTCELTIAESTKCIRLIFERVRIARRQQGNDSAETSPMIARLPWLSGVAGQSSRRRLGRTQVRRVAARLWSVTCEAANVGKRHFELTYCRNLAIGSRVHHPVGIFRDAFDRSPRVRSSFRGGILPRVLRLDTNCPRDELPCRVPNPWGNRSMILADGPITIVTIPSTLSCAIESEVPPSAVLIPQARPASVAPHT